MIKRVTINSYIITKAIHKDKKIKILSVSDSEALILISK